MTDRKVGPKALALMHHFEDCELVAYADPGTGGDPYTIGWGMTYYPDGRKVRRGDRITQAQADADFATILDRDFARIVDAAIGKARPRLRSSAPWSPSPTISASGRAYGCPA